LKCKIDPFFPPQNAVFSHDFCLFIYTNLAAWVQTASLSQTEKYADAPETSQKPLTAISSHLNLNSPAICTLTFPSIPSPWRLQCIHLFNLKTEQNKENTTLRIYGTFIDLILLELGSHCLDQISFMQLSLFVLPPPLPPPLPLVG